MNRLAPAVLLVLAACSPSPSDPTDPTDPSDPTGPTDPTTTTTGLATSEPSFVRPVVLPEHPLTLANAQADVVTWPIWGGATTLGEPVAVRVTLDPTVGDGGLLVAGSARGSQRRTVELRSSAGSWILREVLGNAPVQEVAVPDSVVDFVLELGVDGASIRATWDGGEATLIPGAPLAPSGGEAGLYVTLDVGAELVIPDLAMSVPLPTRPELGTPLRALTTDDDVQIGSAIDVWPPLHDLGFESLLAEQFDTAAPVEFYWPTTRGEDADWFLIPPDLIVNYATVHDQSITGMFLVWDYQVPRWVKDVAEDEGTRALQAVFDEHVTTLASRYAGRVDAWVVVNEAIWGPQDTGGDPAQFAQTFWSRWLGDGYVERAFELARAADPDAVLLYNETGAEVTNQKSDFLYDMAADFVDRGVPLDGIGLQFHVHAAGPPDLDAVRSNFERFAALGLDVYITELDVSLEGIDAPDELELQASIFAGILETCRAVPACRSYTMFGFTDKYAWDELGDADPLIFDEDYQAKPAYDAIQSALGGP